MIKIIYCMRRKPTLTRAEFLAYWRDVHGRMMLEHQDALRVARYAQTAPVDNHYSPRVERAGVLQEPYDGVAEIYWANEDDFRHSFEDPDAKRVQRLLVEDEARFIDHARSARWICQEDEVIG